jgi:transposase
MQDEAVIYGVDVSKAELVVATHPRTVQRVVANQATAIKAWLRTLAKSSCIAVESTGRYPATLVRLAQAAGMTVYVLNARDVYFYAKALGVRGKTDASDAQVIARYLGEHKARLHEYCAGTPQQQRLVELLRRRAQLQRHLDALNQCLKDVSGMGRQRLSLQRQQAKILAEVDAKIQQLIEQDSAARPRYERLQTITGIGPQTAALLTAVLGRVPFDNINAVVAFSGLDPRPADSGTKHGRRRLTKRGPALMRKLLWMAAFSAGHSKLFRPLYDSLLQRGLSPTEATVILARKLLRIAWAVWRTGQPFDPTKAVSLVASPA